VPVAPVTSSLQVTIAAAVRQPPSPPEASTRYVL
jgi:hypothetical protein